MRVQFFDIYRVQKPIHATTETDYVFGNPYSRIHKDSAGLFVKKRGKEILLEVYVGELKVSY